MEEMLAIPWDSQRTDGRLIQQDQTNPSCRSTRGTHHYVLAGCTGKACLRPSSIIMLLRSQRANSQVFSGGRECIVHLDAGGIGHR